MSNSPYLDEEMTRSADRPAIVTVIPTTGAPELLQAVESALGTSDVLCVTDTEAGRSRAAAVLGAVASRVDWLHLPFRVGGGVWGGHRIYAAAPHLVNHELIAFLDEDNWYAPEHLPAVSQMLKSADAAWSHRTIHAKDGTFVCDDRCESLGPKAGVGGRRLVDTSCWAFRTAWLRPYASFWDFSFGADARWSAFAFDQFADRIAATGLYAVRYRLGSSDRSPTAEFFLDGNRRAAADV